MFLFMSFGIFVPFVFSLISFQQEYGSYITGNALNEVRIIGCLTSILLLGIVLIGGMEWEAKVCLMECISFLIYFKMHIYSDKKSIDTIKL